MGMMNDDDDDHKIFFFFFCFFRNKLQVKKNIYIFENPEKTFSCGKYSNFNFQNRGYFGQKKSSANFLKLRSLIVYRTVIHNISAKNFKNFFKWKKIQLQVSKSGVFWQ